MDTFNGGIELTGNGTHVTNSTVSTVNFTDQFNPAAKNTVAAVKVKCVAEAIDGTTNQEVDDGAVIVLCAKSANGALTELVEIGNGNALKIKGGVTSAIAATGAITNLLDLTGITTAASEDNKAAPDKAGTIKILTPAGAVAYINYYDGTPA